MENKIALVILMIRVVSYWFYITKSESHSVVYDSLWLHGLYSPWNSPGQNTGVGICSLLQGIFPTQRLNPGLPHCRQILYQLSHQGSPRILEWVGYPFSSRSSRSRNPNRASCIADGFFTRQATSEAPSWVHLWPMQFSTVLLRCAFP